MNNHITQEVIAEYEAKIKKRLENKPTDNLKSWVYETNALINECNNLLRYEKYKRIEDDKCKNNS